MSDQEAHLSDELLLEICGISPTDGGYSDDLVDDLRFIAALARNRGYPTSEDLDHAIALLTSVLGRHRRQCAEQHPWDVKGPRPRLMDWVEREELESTAKQIVGLLWSESQPSRVAIAVSQATNNAIGDGLIQAHDYDAWHTGMASGSGWRQSVAATTYGVIRARQLSSKAKSNTSLASARRGIGGVSVNTGELGTAVNTHDHGVAVNTAPGGAAISTGDFGVAVSTGGGMQPIPKPGDVDEVRPREADDKYAWARQAELVKAVNDVLGEGTLHKGVLSRACTDGQVETNRQPGPGSRVSTNSFLAWVTRKFELAKNEQTQVRNAVIGEIRARNS